MNIVYWLQNERGFTLIEMLLVLSLSLILLSFVPTFMKTIVTGHQIKEASSEELLVFFNYLSRDIKEASDVTFDQEKILLNKGLSDQYVIERVSTTGQIRRLRNGVGHVLLLDQAESFHCGYSAAKLVECEVVLQSGASMKRTMSAFYPLFFKGDEIVE